MSSQTIGVEFSSKIIKVGTGARRKRIKLQLWDTAGTERFRSVSRSYYRGAAGAILVYDLSSMLSFNALPTFLNDARALASPNLTLLLAGNKVDLASENPLDSSGHEESSHVRHIGRNPRILNESGMDIGQLSSHHSSIGYDLSSHLTAAVPSEGREVASEEASRWASRASIPASVEVSALTGEGVENVFSRLAAMILTKIELGEIDPSDPTSGIQYGDGGGFDDVESIKSVRTSKRRGPGNDAAGSWISGLSGWEAVFGLDSTRGPRRGVCC